MKLLQCYVENFGKLQQFALKFEAGFNTFCAENGWGKTTLITFIKTMFYGLSNYHGSDLEQNERKKYTPWQGGNFGGYLDFETQGKIYRVTRFFGKTNAADSFSLTDLTTGKPSKDYDENLGAAIFDLDAASFMRTLLIPQIAVDSVATTQITDRLINLMQGTNEQSHYETAVKILDDQRRNLSNKAKTGRIESIQKALVDNAMHIERAQQQAAQIANSQIQSADTDQTLLALQERQAAIQQQIGAQSVLKDLPKVQPNHNKQKTFKILSLVFVLCAMIALVVWLIRVEGVVDWSIRYFLIVLGILTVAYFIACLITYFHYRVPKTETPQALPQPTELTALQNELTDLQIQITALISQKTNAQVAEQNAQTLAAELTNLQNERQELNQTLQTLQVELVAVLSAQNFLKTAYENLNAKYLQPMQNSLQKYLQILTNQTMPPMSMDTDFNLSLSEHGQSYSTAYYSRGYQNLFDLCLCLALVDALFPNDEQPLLLLDDPFVNLDEEKTATALQFLRTLSQDRQIIYFTCHAARC